MVVLPLVFVLLTSVNLGPLTWNSSGASLANYVTAWSSESTRAVMLNTVIYGVGSTAISMTFGVFFAFLVERTDMPLKTLAFTAVPLVLALPGILYSIAWALLISPKIGLINVVLLGLFGADSGFFTHGSGLGFHGPPIDGYSLGGMIAAEGLRGIALVFLMTVGCFRNIDATLEEAAATAGAAARRVTFRVTLPLVLPGILAAGLFALTYHLESFEIPGVLGLPNNIHVLATRIWLLTAGNDPGQASALGMIFLLLALLVMGRYVKLTAAAERFATITGKNMRSRVMRLGKLRHVGAAAVILYLLLVVAVPFLIVLWASILPYYQIPSVAAVRLVQPDSYVYLFTNRASLVALRNTLGVTLAAPTLSILVATLVAWFVVRSRLAGRRVLDVITFLPQTVPASIIGIAMLYIFLAPPWRWIPIYGTVWVIAIAIGVRFMAFSGRTMHSAMLQINKELEEAAEVSGVTWFTAFRRIVVPLLLPSILAGWLFVALYGIRETTMPLLLASPNSRVMSLLMWDSWTKGDISNAAATGVCMTAGVAILLCLGRLVDRAWSQRHAGS